MMSDRKNKIEPEHKGRAGAFPPRSARETLVFVMPRPVLAPALALDARTPHAPGGAPSTSPDDAATVGGSRALVCRACRTPITTEDARASLFGAHTHDRMNPSGFVFRIGLFRRAPGALVASPASDEFPWFPGHRWQIVVCRGCIEHLGWLFTGANTFHALVLDKLAAEDGAQTT
jgi:hypothetical protein